jgi:23S rRNA (adenine2503-C2)-methyltransferase
MDLTSLQKILAKEPRYRLQQVKKSLFQDLIDDWSEATTLPLRLRNELKRDCQIGISAETFVSKDQTTEKALITLKDGLEIETVLLCHKGGRRRNTICVSSQVGCALGCRFCATGKMGFKRSLDFFEIVEQVLFFARRLEKTSQKITNVVFMGMGEPFLNYENVIGAVKTLNDKDGFNLGARHFSISTVGIIEGIEKLAQEELQVNLAISLNAPDDALRSKIMPINEKYPIDKILRAVDNYIEKTRRRVMFEYIMINGLNDSDQAARKLIKITKRNLCFVNLIPYNPTGGFEPSFLHRVEKFKKILERGGVNVTQRYRFGREIKAACGQLAAEHLQIPALSHRIIR